MTQSVTGPVFSGHWGIVEWLIVVVPALVLLIIFYAIRKGRRLDGEHVFRASRMSQGNRLFPAQVVITPTSITLYKPQWIGKTEESIHLAHVASVRVDTHLIFADVCIETSGGQEPILCHGHTKGDVAAMKQLLEKYQSDYYRSNQK
jgi:hypothetical protein